MRRFLLIICVITKVVVLFAQDCPNQWGDLGNGTYANPILNADYSDPDVIRVGEKYYMVASDFHFMGMQVLESEDMVNWKLISQVYKRLDYPGFDTNSQYAGGSWAPSIRYHDGYFWIFFCTPKEGLFMTKAKKAAGPWSPLTNVVHIEKWEDPCPFWDEDGQAYLGRSQHGAGPIIIHKMSADGTRLLDEGKVVYTGPVAEGTKIHKLNGYYYISIPEGGVEKGWQTVLRSKNIYGPYEKKVVLEQGTTAVNGPHQGAIVDTPQGEWFFFHFQHCNPIGRVVHLQPMYWHDNWPVVGVDIDGNGIGEPVKTWKKPNVGKKVGVTVPRTSDDFSSPVLSLQWQFNHNPVNDAWSLTDKKGSLTLKALKADNFKLARNTLTQKSMGYMGMVETELDYNAMEDGQYCGLACIGKENVLLGICMVNGEKWIYMDHNNQISPVLKLSSGKKVYLRLQLNAIDNAYQFAYSLDNKQFHLCGNTISMKFGYWKGVRVGLYCYNTLANKGKTSFNWLTYQHDGPTCKKQ
jgi:Beta-xylosidase